MVTASMTVLAVQRVANTIRALLGFHAGLRYLPRKQLDEKLIMFARLDH